jgi:outer membrane protein assembly factor BamE
MRLKIILALMMLSPALPSCTPYKMDIRQGNYVTPDMREKLKVGMTKAQVRFVLGTPLVNDAFHGNRWDYLYRLKHAGKEIEKQNLSLYFEGDNLVRIDDGNQAAPARPEAPMTEAVKPTEEAVPSPMAVPAQSAMPENISMKSRSDPAADVLHVVQDWAAAWSAGDIERYQAFYAPDFSADGMSRKAWIKQREDRINKNNVAKVELGNLKVKLQDENHAAVNFTQTYRSSRYNDETLKTLQLKKVGDTWLIVSEQAEK